MARLTRVPRRIVAVHSLGAHSEHTWMGKLWPSTDESREKTHLLRYLVQDDFPDTKMVSFRTIRTGSSTRPSKQPSKSVVHCSTSWQSIGLGALYGAHASPKHETADGTCQRVPIVFIGHSFGGIIINEVSLQTTQRCCQL